VAWLAAMPAAVLLAAIAAAAVPEATVVAAAVADSAVAAAAAAAEVAAVVTGKLIGLLEKGPTASADGPFCVYLDFGRPYGTGRLAGTLPPGSAARQPGLFSFLCNGRIRGARNAYGVCAALSAARAARRSAMRSAAAG
jgi:hypothetical protein